MYALVKDNAIEKVFYSKPQWFNNHPDNNGELLTDEELKLLYVYPVILNEPNINHELAEVKEKHFSEWLLEIDEETQEVTITATYDTTYYSFDQIKMKKIFDLKNIRKSKVIAGIPLGESSLATDDFTRNILTSLKLLAIDDPDKTWNWKGEDGAWISLTKDMIDTFSGLIANHTQACFDKEHDFLILIDAAETIDDLVAIDINTGWPTTI